MVVHPIQTGPSQSVKVRSTARQDTGKLHPAHKTTDTRQTEKGSQHPRDEKQQEEVKKKRRRGRRKKKSTTSSPGPRCKRSLSVSPESELRGASELPLYIRWTDFKLSLLRLSRKLKSLLLPSYTPCLFFFLFFVTLSCFGLAGSGRRESAESGNSAKIIFFPKTLFVPAQLLHRIPSRSHRTPMEKETKHSQATWERGCDVLLFGFLFSGRCILSQRVPCCFLFCGCCSSYIFSQLLSRVKNKLGTHGATPAMVFCVFHQNCGQGK